MRQWLSLLSFAMVAFMPTIALGQIDGFNFLQDYTFNQADGGTPPTVGDDFVVLSTGASQARNLWFNTRQSIGSFTAQFVYQTSTGGGVGINGLSFIIHNDSDGLSTVTSSSGGSGFTGIDQSIGLVFDLAGAGTSNVGIQQDGTFGSGFTGLGSRTTLGDGLLVTLEYDGTLLDISFDDGLEPAFTQTLFLPDIPDLIGSEDAFIGFGVGSSSISGTQTISNFTFSSSVVAVPEPASAFMFAGLASLVGLKRRRS